jgi:acyl-CoA synthetase (NDP forming)
MVDNDIAASAGTTRVVSSDSVGAARSGRVASLLHPTSVAIVGASEKAGAGRRALEALSHFGFEGAVWGVNPRLEVVAGRQCFEDLSHLPSRPDLVVVAVPAAQAIDVIASASELGVPSAVIFAAGIPEADDGRGSEILETAVAGGMSILGPSTSGFVDFHSGACATFANVHECVRLQPGGLSIISQSGGAASVATALAGKLGLGLRYRITTGTEIDLDVTDFIEHVSMDDETEAVLLFVEGVADGQRFRAACRALVDGGKFVVAVKAGSSAAGAAVSAAHTGRLVGADAAYGAAFTSDGVIRALSIGDAIDIIALKSRLDAKGRGSVCAISVSGGEAALIADDCARYGLDLETPMAATQEALAEVLGPTAVANPIDLTANSGLREGITPQILDIVAADPGFDFIVLSTAYRGLVPQHRETLLRELGSVSRLASKVIITGLMTDDLADALVAMGFFVLPDVSRVLRALAALRRGAIAREPQRSLVAADVPGGIPLSGHSALAAAEEGGIPMARWHLARSIDDLLAAANDIGYPVTLKSAADDLVHKTEHDAVITGLDTAEALRHAYCTISSMSGGFIVQEHVKTRLPELLVSAYRDETLGVVLCVGAGGVLSELLADVTVRIGADAVTASAGMLDELRVGPAFGGYRGMRALPRESFERFIQSVLGYMDTHPHVCVLELNPVLVREADLELVAVDCLLEEVETR